MGKDEYIRKINELTRELENQRYNYDYILNEYNKILYSRSYKLFRALQQYKNIIIDLKLKLTSKKDCKQSVLFFVHSWINVYNKKQTDVGGTTLHVLDLINSIKDKKNCYVISIINNHYVLIVIDKNNQYIYDTNLEVKTYNFDEYDFDFYYLIKLIIKELKIDLLHIHHTSGFPCDLHYLSKEIPTIITLHDYFLLCPNYFMISNYNNKLCYNSTKQNCSKCVGILNNRLSVRNNACMLLFKYVKSVIVPDESVLSEYRRYYSIKDGYIIPHGIDTDRFKKISLSNHVLDTNNINIAFVGFLQKHKGGEIASKLVLLNHSKYKYHLFGTTDIDDLLSNRTNFINHGRYERYDLPKLLSDNNIDLVLLLSTCPETYNYCLSEISLAKIPVLCFDIGAIANRVRNNKIGWVIDKKNDFDYRDILEKYKLIFKNEEYQKVLKNYDKYECDLLFDMINSTNNLYDDIIKKNKLKKYYEINKFLNSFYKKYTL